MDLGVRFEPKDINAIGPMGRNYSDLSVEEKFVLVMDNFVASSGA